ncbi:uncharacterized protein LOC5510988 [Nematostella vectensis]|uniref:uncharacterized protein LOC5510988 n=1 Tax=Nematostella vectensis TaxID=45351 RepID=UPI002077980B|nr:uncharacterized protein LOC5510988 [Nematostella vectensis]
MSGEGLALRSGLSSVGDLGSQECYSSSEASSRLWARLERSEYKRTRGKQRRQSGTEKTHDRKRDRDGRSARRNAKFKSNNQLTTTSFQADKQIFGNEEAVTSIWEVSGKKTQFYSEQSFISPDKEFESYTPHRLQKGLRRDNRPYSIHEISLETQDIETYQGNGEPHTLTGRKHSLIQESQDIWKDMDYRERKPLSHDSDRLGDSKKLGKAGQCLSRSLSSSLSSHVGSSDEKEDYQGIYSAYDMTGRSPYGSSISRRYSQSSLSSSNTSWQHSSSHNIKELPSLLGSAPERIHHRSPVHNSNHENFKITDFNRIEKTPPSVPPKPTRFSASCTIKLSSRSKDGAQGEAVYERTESSSPNSPRGYQTRKAVPVIDFTKPSTVVAMPVKGPEVKPSVREMAKRFSANVTHVSSECHSRIDDDTRRVKTETWPKVVSVVPQEGTSPIEVPRGTDTPAQVHHQPGLTYTAHDGTVVQLRQKDDTRKEDLASHRLSLQELILLHEEQIALHTRSAQATVQMYLKRSASDVGRRPEPGIYGQNSKADTRRYSETHMGHSIENTFVTSAGELDLKLEIKKPETKKPEYEVREMTSPRNSPFKVIELTDKSTGSISSSRERLPRMKRHRTIGIVGFRHQIDRTLDAKTQSKPKRHTAIGIVNLEAISMSHLDSSDVAFNTTRPKSAGPELISPEDDELVTKVNVNEERFPPKVFDFETPTSLQTHQEPEATQKVMDDVEVSVETPVVLEQAQESYSSVPKMDLNEEDGPVGPPTIRKYQPKPSQPDYVQPTDGEKKIEEVRRTTLSPNRDTPPSIKSPVVELHKSGVARYRAMVSAPQSDGNALDSTSPITDTAQITPSRPVVTSSPLSASANVSPKTVAEVIPVPRHSGISKFPDTKTSLAFKAPRDPCSFGNKIQEKKQSGLSPYEPHMFQLSGIKYQDKTSLSVTPPEPLSAQEMYQTRLAMWNLIPGWEGSNSSTSRDGSRERLSKEHPLRDATPRGSRTKMSEERGKHHIDDNDNHKALHQRTEEYYMNIIDRLKRDYQSLKEKSETEKREFRQMYEEQKKVANAYQKLEDRYRRRVHELQDALAGCTCKGTLMVYQKSMKSTSVRSDVDSGRSKASSIKSHDIHILDEVEEWLSEQSKNAKTTKANNASRDSLISSSSDLTGTGWDDHYEMMGAIDQLDGTHV